jgi:hypothetical protein
MIDDRSTALPRNELVELDALDTDEARFNSSRGFEG